jgi:4-hydroxybenzoate-CoA ligase
MSNAADWFVDRHVREGRGDRIAFIDPWRTLTYGELDTATRRFASALARAGIEPERRVVLLLLDTVDFPIAFWGCLRAGVIPVPINTLLTADMIAYILADSRAEAAVVSAGLGGECAGDASDECFQSGWVLGRGGFPGIPRIRRSCHAQPAAFLR